MNTMAVAASKGVMSNINEKQISVSLPWAVTLLVMIVSAAVTLWTTISTNTQRVQWNEQQIEDLSQRLAATNDVRLRTSILETRLSDIQQSQERTETQIDRLQNMLRELERQ